MKIINKFDTVLISLYHRTHRLCRLAQHTRYSQEEYMRISILNYELYRILKDRNLGLDF